ncbi:Dabb family protein [Solicola sp. PLA-1-18]|uniref:Dabb family protein n=1 Tax=Solicola sp. PLA-1-18 TaxID=3380532 RepID=UPI003B80DFA5
MLTHVWNMTFTPEATPDQRTALVAAMRALPSQIDGVESFRSGVDLGLNPGNAEVVIVAEFADSAAWQAYLEAPAHVAFVNDHVTPLCASWSAIQFDADAS